MKNRLSLTTIAIATLTACGGGSSGSGDDDILSAASDIQGRWIDTECVAAADNESSERIEFTFEGQNITESEVSYVSNPDCLGEVTISINLLGTFSVPGDTTTTDRGDAKHIDIAYTKGTVTASSAMSAVFESQGTSLEAAMLAQGIADINNIPVSALRDTNIGYTIYQVAGSSLFTGESDSTFTGSEPTLRHNTLNPENFIRP